MEARVNPVAEALDPNEPPRQELTVNADLRPTGVLRHPNEENIPPRGPFLRYAEKATENPQFDRVTMPRYLTPSRVSLLALIVLYHENTLPSQHIVPLVNFLKPYILPLAIEDANPAKLPNPPAASVLSVEDFQWTLMNLDSSVPGRNMWDLLLKKLWEINSLDALFSFFDSLPFCLAKTAAEKVADEQAGIEPPSDKKIRVTRTSPMGAYLRRGHLEFTRLQFHDAQNLWVSFIRFRDPTLAQWRKRNPSAGENSFDAVLRESGLDWEDDLTKVVYEKLRVDDKKEGLKEGEVSTDDVERLLEFQVEQMQKFGSRIDDGPKKKLKLMLESGVTIPSLVHYVKFLDAWRAGDYPGAFDGLHRYFDYTMHNRDRTFYQYALLNFALLQADFGCYGEALAALQETIASARENKDTGCLNFALSWLYHFEKLHPEEFREGTLKGVQREGLAFLKAKAKESSMWSLLATCLLSEAKVFLENGESIPRVMEALVQASHIHVTKGVTNTIGPQTLLKASLWSRLGLGHLAMQECEMFLLCYASRAPVEDAVGITCRSAWLFALEGRYEKAFERLSEVTKEQLKILKVNQYWTMFSGLIKTKRQLHRGDLDAAREMLDQLMSAPPTDPDIKFELTVMKYDLFRREGNYKDALALIENTFKPLKEESSDILQRVRLMILKAQLLATIGRPLKGVSIIVNALSIAKRAKLQQALWEAVGCMSKALTTLEEPDKAYLLMHTIMPMVHETEDSYLVAQSYMHIVTAMSLQARDAGPKGMTRKNLLNKCQVFLDRALKEFEHLEDYDGIIDALWKKGFCYRRSGDQGLADQMLVRAKAVQKKWGKGDEVEAAGVEAEGMTAEPVD